MTQEELNTILDAHEVWVNSKWTDVSAKGKVVLENEVMYELDFSGRNLSEITFKHCDLSRSNFTDCDLHGATFEDTILAYANFEKCNLNYSVIERCDCTWADFNHATFHHSRFNGAYFMCGCLTSADFTDAVMEHTTFIHNNMIGTKFCNVDARDGRNWIAHPIIHQTDFTGMKLGNTTLCSFQPLTPRSGTIGLNEETDVPPDDNDENMIFGGD
jgi:uncharacterized protein YjbI with pentapeptide repeats